MHLAQAVHQARWALESGDPERIEIASLSAPTLERTGRELERKYAEAQRRAETEAKRQKGGKVAGAIQSRAAALWWAPYQQHLDQLVRDGMEPARARQTVVAEIAKKQHPPDERTIRKWLPLKKFRKPA